MEVIGQGKRQTIHRYKRETHASAALPEDVFTNSIRVLQPPPDARSARIPLPVAPFASDRNSRERARLRGSNSEHADLRAARGRELQGSTLIGAAGICVLSTKDW